MTARRGRMQWCPFRLRAGRPHPNAHASRLAPGSSRRASCPHATSLEFERLLSIVSENRVLDVPPQLRGTDGVRLVFHTLMKDEPMEEPEPRRRGIVAHVPV